MRIRRLVLLCLLVSAGPKLFAQFHLEAGINYLNGASSLNGMGVYLEPRYAVARNADVELHVSYNWFLGYDRERTKSGRISTGTIPMAVVKYVRHFPNPRSSKDVPYIGLGAGVYLSEGDPQRIEGVQPGVALSFGVFLGRSNIGITQNFVPDKNSFIQINYGFRILNRRFE